jgi:hypothetical protein
LKHKDEHKNDQECDSVYSNSLDFCVDDDYANTDNQDDYNVLSVEDSYMKNFESNENNEVYNEEDGKKTPVNIQKYSQK